MGCRIPYARHYNPRFVYFLPPFYIEEWFILQTIYVQETENLHFLSLKSAVYTQEQLHTDQEWVIVARIWYAYYCIWEDPLLILNVFFVLFSYICPILSNLERKVPTVRAPL